MFLWRWSFAQHRRQVYPIFSVEPNGAGICGPQEHVRIVGVGPKVSSLHWTHRNSQSVRVDATPASGELRKATQCSTKRNLGATRVR
jgi:hypothetical protein